MNWRSKWTFWATVAAILALVSVPSVEWVTALTEYRRVWTGFDPAPLKPTMTTYTPRETRGEELKAVEFRHKAPKAKKVELVGDFNAWKPGLLKLSKGEGGWWSISVPVPVGKRRYLFLVDGEPAVDEKAETTDGPQGRRVSVKAVK